MLGDQAHPLVGVELAHDDDGAREHVGEEGEGVGTGVVQRPRRQMHLLAPHAQFGDHGEDQGLVGGAPLGALGLSGRAGRVNHRLAGRGLARRHRLLLGAVGEHVAPRAEAVLAAPIHHDLPQLRQVGPDRRDQRCLLGVDDDQGRLAVLDDVVHLLGVEAVGERYRHQPELASGVDRHQHLAAVRAAPHHAIARLEPEVLQPADQAVHFSVDLGEGEDVVAFDHRRPFGAVLGVEGEQIGGSTCHGADSTVWLVRARNPLAEARSS